MGRIPSSEGLARAPTPNAQPNVRLNDDTRGLQGLTNLAKQGAALAGAIEENRRDVQIANQVTEDKRRISEHQESLKNSENFDSFNNGYTDLVKSLSKDAKKNLGGDRLFSAYTESMNDYVYKHGETIRSAASTGQLKRNKDNTDALIPAQASLIADAVMRGDSDEAAALELDGRALFDRAEETGTYIPSEKAAANKAFTQEISGIQIHRDYQDDPQRVIDRLQKGDYQGLEGEDRVEWRNKALSRIEQQKHKQDVERKQLSTEIVSDTILALNKGYPVSADELSEASKASIEVGKNEEFENAVAASQFILLPKSSRDQLTPKIVGISHAELRNKLEKTSARISAEVKKDGFAFGVAQDLIEPSPLSLTDASSIEARIDQADYLTKHYGMPVSPLTQPEAQSLSEALANMTAQEKTQMAMALGDSQAVWAQLDDKNAGLFAMTGAIGDRNIMENVFRGEKLIEDKLAHPLKRNDYLGDFDDYVGGVYGGEDRKQILKAALAHYAGSARNDAYDSGDFEDSIEAVTGGVAKINGSKVELPRDVSEDDFDDYIDDFSPAMVGRFGAVLGHSSEQASEVIQKSQLISVGNNRYQVSPDGVSLLINASTQQPYEIGFDRQAFEDRQGLLKDERDARNKNPIGQSR